MAVSSGSAAANQNLVNLSSTYLAALGLTPSKIKESATTQKQGVEAAQSVVNAVITTPVNIVSWLTNNWQIAVVGVVALLVLIRD